MSRVSRWCAQSTIDYFRTYMLGILYRSHQLLAILRAVPRFGQCPARSDRTDFEPMRANPFAKLRYGLRIAQPV